MATYIPLLIGFLAVIPTAHSVPIASRYGISTGLLDRQVSSVFHRVAAGLTTKRPTSVVQLPMMNLSIHRSLTDNLMPFVVDQLMHQGFQILANHSDGFILVTSLKRNSGNGETFLPIDEKELKGRLLLDAFQRLDAPAELAELWILSDAYVNWDGFHHNCKTALQWAVGRNWPSVVQLLLHQQTTESFCDETAFLLHQAVRVQCDEGILRHLLLGCPAMDINARDGQDQTALHLAASMNRPDLVELLLQSGADMEIEDHLGFRPLHCAAASTSRTGTGTTRVAALLINRGADFEAVTDLGMTPLHLAVIWDQVGAARLLLKAGANMRAFDHYGRTSLDYALMIHGQESPMQTLLAPYAFVHHYIAIIDPNSNA